MTTQSLIWTPNPFEKKHAQKLLLVPLRATCRAWAHLYATRSRALPLNYSTDIPQKLWFSANHTVHTWKNDHRCTRTQGLMQRRLSHHFSTLATFPTPPPRDKYKTHCSQQSSTYRTTNPIVIQFNCSLSFHPRSSEAVRYLKRLIVIWMI